MSAPTIDYRYQISYITNPDHDTGLKTPVTGARGITDGRTKRRNEGLRITIPPVRFHYKEDTMEWVKLTTKQSHPATCRPHLAGARNRMQTPRGRILQVHAHRRFSGGKVLLLVHRLHERGAHATSTMSWESERSVHFEDETKLLTYWRCYGGRHQALGPDSLQILKLLSTDPAARMYAVQWVGYPAVLGWIGWLRWDQVKFSRVPMNIGSCQ